MNPDILNRSNQVFVSFDRMFVLNSLASIELILILVVDLDSFDVGCNEWEDILCSKADPSRS